MTATTWLNRAVSALLALALLIGSLLVLAEVVAAAVDRGPWLVAYPEWTEWMRSRSWNDWVVNVILVGLVLVGLLLLGLALRRGKPATLPLRDRTPGVAVKASRRSVERSLAAAASRATGVTGADASVRRRSARVGAKASTRSDPELRGEVESAVKERLGSLELARDLRTRVAVSTKERR
jgi:hypothetical protein